MSRRSRNLERFQMECFEFFFKNSKHSGMSDSRKFQVSNRYLTLGPNSVFPIPFFRVPVGVPRNWNLKGPVLKPKQDEHWARRSLEIGPIITDRTRSQSTVVKFWQISAFSNSVQNKKTTCL